MGHACEQCSKNKNIAETTGMNLPKQTELSFCEGWVAGKMKQASYKPVG